MTGSQRLPLAAVAAVLALTLAGCGLGASPRPAAPATTSPPASSTASHGASGTPTPAQITAAGRTHEIPTPTGRSAVPGGWRTPVGAVEVFAVTYVNWTAATVAPRLRALAQVSLGQARSAMRLAAAQVARDATLRSSGIANSGVIEAIAPVTGRPRAYAVVTRERTTASSGDAYRGLAPAWHVTVATVTRLPDGLWVLDGWQPES